jgi:hypothetical protein
MMLEGTKAEARWEAIVLVTLRGSLISLVVGGCVPYLCCSCVIILM